MMKKYSRLKPFLFYLIFFFSFISCTKKDDTIHIDDLKPSILQFAILNPVCKGIISNDTILVVVPPSTDITALKSAIVTSNTTTISPEKNGPQDFSIPIKYKLTNNDGSGSTSIYTVIVKKSPWGRLTNNAFSSSRDGVGGLVFQDKMWALGGWNGSVTTSEVYNSIDGITWNLVTPKADWSARHCAGYAVFKDKMWIISGDGNPDVWNSEDGINWTCINSNAPWGSRYSPYVVVFNNKLWLMGGQWYSPTDWQRYDPAYTVNGYSDVWSSEDGITWKQELSEAPWGPRALIHGTVVFKNKVWIIGGGLKGVYPYQGWDGTIIEYNDVWSSSDCILWEKVTDHAPWKPRTHFSVSVFNDLMFVTDGSVGTQATLSNEVWYSPDGKNWKEVKGTLWPSRHASCLLPFANNLYLICGFSHNDVWEMTETSFLNFTN